MKPATFRLLLLGLVLFGAGCAESREEVGFEARVLDGGRLAVRIRPLPGTWTHLVHGPLWEGGDPLLPQAAGAAFKIKHPSGKGVAARSLHAAPLPAGREYALEFPSALFPQGEGVIQLVATKGKELFGGPFLGVSRAYVIHRSDGSLEVREFAGAMLEEHGAGALAFVCVLLLLTVGLSRLRLEALKPHRLGAVLLFLLIALFVSVRAISPADRTLLDGGRGVVPLLWPEEWSLTENGWERFLGPGFAPLLDAARARAGQGRLVVSAPARQGRALQRAVVLHYLVPESRLVLDGKLPRDARFLVSFETSATGGRKVLETPAGTLWALAEGEGR